MNKVDEYNAVELLRMRMRPRVASIVRFALNAQLEKVITAVENGMPNPDFFIKESDIREAFNQVYPMVGNYFAKRTYRKLAKIARKDRANDLTRVFTQLMQDFVSRRLGERITRITATTKSIVKRVVAMGDREGWGSQKIANILRKNWTKLSKSRSIVIARTEIMSASNYGSQIGALQVAKDLDVEIQKEWIARIDSRTRDPHKTANGQTRAIDKSFSVGGEQLEYPGDPKGSAANTIQCRCTVGFIVV